MDNERIDLLAVRAAEILSEGHGRELLAIRIARLEQRDAAVAELIEADKEYDAINAERVSLSVEPVVVAQYSDWSRRMDEMETRLEAATERRRAALARVQGGTP